MVFLNEWRLVVYAETHLSDETVEAISLVVSDLLTAIAEYIEQPLTDWFGELLRVEVEG